MLIFNLQLTLITVFNYWRFFCCCWLFLREIEIEHKKKEKAWASRKLRKMQDRFDGQLFFFGNSLPLLRSSEFYTKGRSQGSLEFFFISFRLFFYLIVFSKNSIFSQKINQISFSWFYNCFNAGPNSWVWVKISLTKNVVAFFNNSDGKT